MQNLTHRRHFIGAAGAMAATATVLQPARAQSPQISNAVFAGLTSASVYICQRVAANKLTGSDVRVFANALGTYFANLEEIGALPKLQTAWGQVNWQPLSWERFSEIRAAAANEGAAVSDAQFAQMFNAQLSSVPNVPAAIARQGLQQFHGSAIANLAAFASRLDALAVLGDGGRVREAQVCGSTVNSVCYGVGLIAGYFTVWGAMAYYYELEALAALLASGAGIAVITAVGLIGLFCTLVC